MKTTLNQSDFENTIIVISNDTDLLSIENNDSYFTISFNSTSKELLTHLQNETNKHRTTENVLKPKHYHLTKRETEILLKIYKGKKRKEIAEELFISKKTIENHRNNILKKSGHNSMLTLINYLAGIGFFKEH
ncbi:MAG: helix-turn-helix transcriptional regulator [Bacteroidia bacterium]